MDIVTLALARRMAKSAAQQASGGTPQFNTKDEAVQWAKDNGMVGSIVTVKEEDGYVPYIVEDDYTLTPIQGECIDAGDSEIIDGGSPGDSEYTIIDGGSLSGN